MYSQINSNTQKYIIIINMYYYFFILELIEIKINPLESKLVKVLLFQLGILRI